MGITYFDRAHHNLSFTNVALVNENRAEFKICDRTGPLAKIDVFLLSAKKICIFGTKKMDVNGSQNGVHIYNTYHVTKVGI